MFTFRLCFCLSLLLLQSGALIRRRGERRTGKREKPRSMIVNLRPSHVMCAFCIDLDGFMHARLACRYFSDAFLPSQAGFRLFGTRNYCLIINPPFMCCTLLRNIVVLARASKVIYGVLINSIESSSAHLCNRFIVSRTA
jgi:hypothetical protein